MFASGLFERSSQEARIREKRKVERKGDKKSIKKCVTVL